MPAGTGILLVNPYIHDFSAYNLWMRPRGLVDIYGFLRGEGIQAFYTDALFPSREESERYGLAWPESKKYHTGKFPEEFIEKPAVYGRVPRRYRRFGVPPVALMERFSGFRGVGCILLTSGMTYWYPGVRETARLCRRAFPGIPVVLGGVYATLCPEHARRHSGADFVLTGSWRNSLPRLLSKLFGRKVSCMENPGADGRFETLLYPESGFATAKLGEGCPFACGYCASGLLSGGARKHLPGEVFGGIKEKAANGIKDIAFYDDALLAGADESLIPLLELIARSDLKCRFHAPNGLHARYMTPRVAGLFMECGFRTVRLSFDRSGDGDSDRKVSAAGLKSAARFLARAGYDPGEIEVYTLVGLKGQEDAEIFETFRLIRGEGLKIKPAFYSPVPGTAFFGRDRERVPGLAEEPLLQNSTAAAVWGFETGRHEELKEKARGG